MKRYLLISVLIVLGFLVLLPILWTFATSLKPLPEVNTYPPEWTSPNMSFQPYVDMFFYLPFSTYTLNSLIVALSATFLTLLIGSLAGFAFSRFQFPGKGLFLLVFLLSLTLRSDEKEIEDCKNQYQKNNYCPVKSSFSPFWDSTATDEH